jgi:hypothetical protein
MKDYISLGSAPNDEPCIQVGSPEATPAKQMAECRRFINRIRQVIGPEPEGARLLIKRCEHDFGSYYDVQCEYDDQVGEDYALSCEGVDKWEVI